jgi:hypothetical protein
VDKHCVFLSSILFGAVLSGCTTTPQFDFDTKNPRAPTVAHIVDRVQCEILRAAKENPKLVEERYVSVANLFLQIDESAGLTPTLTWINPLAAATSFTLGGSANLSTTSQRIYEESFTIEVKDLVDNWNAKDQKRHKGSCESKDDYDLAGDLGIDEVIRIALHSIDEDDTASLNGAKSTDAFGETVQFTVVKNVNAVGPNWALQRFKGPGGFIGVGRTDTHKLVISFAPSLEPKPTAKSKGKLSLLRTAPTPKNAAIAAMTNNQTLIMQGLNLSIPKPLP